MAYAECNEGKESSERIHSVDNFLKENDESIIEYVRGLQISFAMCFVSMFNCHVDPLDVYSHDHFGGVIFHHPMGSSSQGQV